MQRQCHELDMNFGGSWGTEHIASSEHKQYYLISSLMEEAISSSQMEGASTTRQVAKEMLRKESKPRDKHQQMIANNYQTIRFIVEHRNDDLSPELLCHIHHLITEGTLNNQEDEGCLRQNNEVVVANEITGEVVHTSPCYTTLPKHIEALCAFFNSRDNRPFIHPIIRGIIIHFMIAYLHPFVDGNGRTARALFYWYMIRSGYWLIEYLSISRLIHRSKNDYEKAFLYTEADELDMGYFISYHLSILEQAFAELELYIARKHRGQNEAQSYLLLGEINNRQAEIIYLYNEEPKLMLTVKELTQRFSIAPATAKADLVGLMDKGLVEELQLNKVKRGYIRSQNFDSIIQQVHNY